MQHDRLKFWTLYGLTFGRIPLVLAFLLINLLVDLRGRGGWTLVCLVLIGIAALSDLLDGKLARRWGMTSRLGAYADPLTDKIFYLTVLPTLVWMAAQASQGLHARLLLGLTVVFLLRDQWVSFLRSIGTLHGADVRANWAGKARTALSFPVACVVFYALAAPAGWRLQFPLPLLYALEAACVLINVISLWTYTRQYWPYLRREAGR